MLLSVSLSSIAVTATLFGGRVFASDADGSSSPVASGTSLADLASVHCYIATPYCPFIRTAQLWTATAGSDF